MKKADSILSNERRKNTEKSKGSKTLRSLNSYDNTAYNSTKVTLQEQQGQQSFYRRMVTKGKSFGFTQTNDTVSISAISLLTPSKMAEVGSEGKENHWNENRLIEENFTGWSHFYFFLVGIAKVCLIFIWPLFYAIFSLGLIFGVGGWESRSPVFYGLTLYCVLPCLVIYGHYLLLHMGYTFLAPFIKPTRIFELNRQNGTVTLFKNNKVRFCHPFVEFDCVLLSSPSHQGHLSYSLNLIHRYKDYNVGVPLGLTMLGQHERVEEYYRLWNMIQQYMDTSRPLPDIMDLEDARQYDKTTVAYDTKHKRDPRYWRDMTEEQFEQALQTIQQKQRKLPTTGAPLNIFKP